MAYCKECGAYIAEGFEKCPACGKSIREKKKSRDDAWDIYEDNGYKGGAAAYQRQTRRQENWSEQGERQHRAQREEFRAEEWQSGPSNGRPFDGEVVDAGTTTETRILAACSYLSWLFLIPFFAKREDPYVKFHLNQGIILFLIAQLKWIMGGLGTLAGVFAFVLCIMGAISALSGKEKRLPLIGDIRIIK